MREEAWLWGWDETPGVVSVWARGDGRVWRWRRDGQTGALVQETARFRPWLLVCSLEPLLHLGERLRPERLRRGKGDVCYEELSGEGELRYLLRADDLQTLSRALLWGAARRDGRTQRPYRSLRELGDQELLVLPPEEQYLVASGVSYFRELSFQQLQRMQIDLETTGLDPAHDRVFMAALRTPRGDVELLEAEELTDAGEARLIERLAQRVAQHDPDVIENHNLHGFDLPFLVQRARTLNVSLSLGRLPGPPQTRAAARGMVLESAPQREGGRAPRVRYTVPGRELIDTMDAVRRHDFSARDLPSHGLKAVARHFGVASSQREYVPGARIYEVYTRDPARVRRYAQGDVEEVEAIARLLGGAAFALARMAPRRYERLADAGPATGVLDPLLVRAYLREGVALPTRAPGDGTPHTGAALHLFATGVARRIVKADVASLYPSLMREYRIGPRRDRLGVLLSLVDRLVDQRLAAKARARTAPAGSSARHMDEALSAAMKIVVNSAYGYLGAVQLTRFADVHAANQVTRRGREVLALICSQLAARGVTLLEADTDGVYFAVPEHFSVEDEARVVREVAALLPARIQLELEGRYAAMLSHEPKNYALLPYQGPLLLRGVAFRSSRAEPFGERFLREALARLLEGDVPGVRDVYVRTFLALRRRELPTRQVCARVRLTKTPAQYLATRAERRELPYEALLGQGRTAWRPGDGVLVYRASDGRAGLLHEADEGEPMHDPRDYDEAFYLKQLQRSYAVRLERALTPEDFAAVCADPTQLSLFARPLHEARPVLTVLAEALPPG